MNWKQKYSENKKLITLYDDFLMTTAVAFGDRLRLITEIARLHEQNKKIEQMTVAKFHKNTNDYKFELDWMSCIV